MKNLDIHLHIAFVCVVVYSSPPTPHHRAFQNLEIVVMPPKSKRGSKKKPATTTKSTKAEIVTPTHDVSDEFDDSFLNFSILDKPTTISKGKQEKEEEPKKTLPFSLPIVIERPQSTTTTTTTKGPVKLTLKDKFFKTIVEDKYSNEIGDERVLIDNNGIPMDDLFWTINEQLYNKKRRDSIQKTQFTRKEKDFLSQTLLSVFATLGKKDILLKHEVLQTITLREFIYKTWGYDTGMNGAHSGSEVATAKHVFMQAQTDGIMRLLARNSFYSSEVQKVTDLRESLLFIQEQWEGITDIWKKYCDSREIYLAEDTVISLPFPVSDVLKYICDRSLVGASIVMANLVWTLRQLLRVANGCTFFEYAWYVETFAKEFNLAFDVSNEERTWNRSDKIWRSMVEHVKKIYSKHIYQSDTLRELIEDQLQSESTAKKRKQSRSTNETDGYYNQQNGGTPKDKQWRQEQKEIADRVLNG